MTLVGKQPRLAEMVSKGQNNREWIIDGSYKYQLQAHDQQYKQRL